MHSLRIACFALLLGLPSAAGALTEYTNGAAATPTTAYVPWTVTSSSPPGFGIEPGLTGG